MKIKLDDVIEAMEFASDDHAYYLNITNGDVLMLSDPLISGFDNEEIEEEIEANSKNYKLLPTKFDINEYHIMEQFIWELTDARKQSILERAISGRGAFRRFKDTVCNLNLEQKWYKYRDDTYKNLAMEWCKDNNLEWE